MANRKYEIRNLSAPIVDASERGDMAWAMTNTEKKMFEKETSDLLGVTITSRLIK